jgi:nickel-type superoxide dismutase maturation protease
VFQILKVTGASLSPSFQEGDYVVVIKVPFLLSTLRSGNVIVFNQPQYGVMIKRIDDISPDGDHIFVLGSHPESTDSRQFGPISRSDVIGKVLWHIKTK